MLLTREDGEVVGDIPGFGLFFRDTCYLASYALHLHGTKPLSLMSSASEGLAARLVLTNDALDTANGRTIPDHTLTLHRTLLLLDDGPCFTDRIEVTNYGQAPVTFLLTLTLSTIFESMFHLRGAPQGKRGTLRRPEWSDGTLRFVYDGTDAVRRTLLARSLTDIALLSVERPPHRFTAAGVPWFVGLFGRDSLLPTIQCLAFNPALGKHTTRALAHWQGKRDVDKTMEQPGKILHELRVGEMTHLHEVTQTPSYAAVDSTLLYLIAIARHVNWTGDMTLFEELRPSIDAALAWLDRKTAETESGYVTYDGIADAHGQPINQSWRDSGTGVLRGDGDYPKPPLALVEVQGYAYQSRLLIAGLFRRAGEDGRAETLETAARGLQARFLREFWMEDEGCYALALEAGGKQVTSVASNAAQVLWTGIATPEHAARIAERMMRPDMFSGWGIRTLSSDHPRFDPLAYQQGSIWPFDTALIVSGLRRYGQDDAALRLVRATTDAAASFRQHRLPEFIAGTRRHPGDAPTHTPRADPMQAWSAAAPPFMVTELLGLEIDGFEHRVTVRRPFLPPGVRKLRIADLQVGSERVTLDIAADTDGRARVSMSGAAGASLHHEE